MFAKFETKSSRVKGVSFHPTRPWILCSLHDGQIQLWDYRVGTLLETYQEHEGPVRSVDFHPTQPIFVSGGDDYKIRMWNYRQKRCTFALLGHLDYIRTVQFHKRYPWILSASDDQNIRIWNYQSRECLTVLAGHNHYVMSAQFHPTEDLVVSASLDQTIRLWDITNLRVSTQRAPSTYNTAASSVINRLGSEILGVVKFVLEGHERGVNWASFHPDLPMIISGSDDRTIKIWRYNDIRAWETDTLRGHTNNVSCVIFHPKDEYIISDSEDHTIRVWDQNKRTLLQTFLRPHDRYWILAAHRSQSLIAAGHDSGACVFKLRRERIHSVCHNDAIIYLKDRNSIDTTLYYKNLLDGKVTKLFSKTKGPSCDINCKRVMLVNQFNPEEHQLLLFSNNENGQYELVVVPDLNRNINAEINEDSKFGRGLSVCFTSRNKFAVLENNAVVSIRNLENQVTKRVNLPITNVNHIYSSCVAGQIILQTEDSLVFFDYSSGQILGTLAFCNVKKIIWDMKNSRAAVVCKRSISIINKSFKVLCTISEILSVKDAVWDDNGVVLYSTLCQLKYLLPSGEQGIVRSFDSPVYIVRVKSNTLLCFDKAAVYTRIEINPMEYLFKLALEQGHYKDAIRIIKSHQVDGQAIVAYLQRKGFEDIALHFVQEPRARFNLAIRCGNLEIALDSAHILDEPTIWNSLATEALRQGNHQIVEMCYQKTKSFDKLSFLYLLTGNMDKLSKMLKIAEMRGDIMSRFHNALYLGDVESRVNILEEVGQYTLAYLTAATYGLEEQQEELKQKLMEEHLPIPELNEKASLLMPPLPLTQEGNWPLLETPKSTFDRVMEEVEKDSKLVLDEHGYPVLMDYNNEQAPVKQEEAAFEAEDDLFEKMEDDGNGWDEDLDIDLEDTDTAPLTTSIDTKSDVPAIGNSVTSQWCSDSSLVHDHAAAGSIDSAVQLLKRQIGVYNYEPLTTSLLSCYTSVHGTIPGFPGTTSMSVPLYRVANDRQTLPLSVYRIEHLSQIMKMGLRFFQMGKFEECLTAFRQLLVILPIMVVENKEEENKLKEMLTTAREYILAVLLEFARRENKADVQKSLAYSYAMTHCDLQPSHMLLALNLAMVAAFKIENFIDAAKFANRILNNSEIHAPKNAALEQKTRKVLIRSEKEGRNTVDIHYDSDKMIFINSGDLSMFYREEDIVKCPYCGANYTAEYKNTICTVCTLSKVGAEALGLVTVTPHY